MNKARTLRLTAAAGTELAGASYRNYSQYLDSLKALYRKLTAFIMHALSPGQGLPHCPKFLTAAHP
jgi:hypothetical protein